MHMTSIDPFIDRFAEPMPASGAGPLSGLRVAVKDNFDIAGTVTGAGNPEWAATHVPAAANAAVVSALLERGAMVVGKTHMDELAYSLMGQNARYGTPVNGACPLRMPGGSSSGSASAVALGLADIGLGSDTGGSVRLPASFCGLFGWRPTHGLLSPGGMVGLAPSYDVPGFMTKDLQTMDALVIAFADAAGGHAATVRVPSDIWQLVSPATRAALAHVVPQGDRSDLFADDIRSSLLPTFRVCQGYEIARLLGPWIGENNPAFGPGIRERFSAALALTEDEFRAAKAARERICAALELALRPGTILVYPTAPGAAPLLTATDLNQYRNEALTLLSIAGHAGLPQLTLPLGEIEGAPLGLSLVGPRGSDADLFEFAKTIVAEAASHVG